MAKQVQITIFTFDELPKESQQSLIERFRQDFEPDYSNVYDEFIIDMSEQYGADIKEDDIQWTGFWSQGDGACFICDFDQEVIEPILRDALSEDDRKHLDQLSVELSQASSIRTGPSNFYSHENTVTGDIWFVCPDDTNLNADIIQTMESRLTEIIRDACRDLYQRLEAEYDRATSDNALIEEIKNIWPGCNFRKDGTIFAR
tara:strand:+ start:424 stop:1029 length:606 start_codon:yes stop_codon:yes gene_type:complete